MHAMLFVKSGLPLKLVQREEPEAGPGELLLRVSACGVCRTDLHIIDSELSKPKLPLIIGHEIVGRVLQIAAKIPIRSDVTVYPLEDANKALDDLRHGRFHGAAVLSMSE